MPSVADYSGCRRSQTDFTLRCLFPKYNDWDIAYTPRGLLKQKFHRFMSHATVSGLMIGLALGYLSGYGLEEMARLSVAVCLGTLKDQASWLQSRVQI